MPVARVRRAALFLAAAALMPLAQAQAAPCSSAGASAITVGSVAEVAPGAARSFTLSLRGGDSVIVDLVRVQPATEAGEGDGHEHGEGSAAQPQRSLSLCDAGGRLLAPQPGEVFAKGGSVTAIEEGERLRFVAPAAAQYVIVAKAAEAPRELLVRRREGGATQATVVPVSLGGKTTGIVSSSGQMVYSFQAPAGQWVEITATSEKDTLLRLAGPDRDGSYSQLAENDDSDGLNPKIRRKLALAGTYYVQVDSLAADPGEFELSLKRVEAPKPPPPPAALRTGAPVSGRLADNEAVMLYSLPVMAGRSYRLELTAAYDGVVAIGLPNPVEPEDGSDKPDAGFAEVKSQDSGTSGTERLDFTARSTGSLLVRVRSFGIGETDGAFTLLATDRGN
jgi:Bacterial pre-peptidase C-terminal domain